MIRAVYGFLAVCQFGLFGLTMYELCCVYVKFPPLTFSAGMVCLITGVLLVWHAFNAHLLFLEN